MSEGKNLNRSAWCPLIHMQKMLRMVENPTWDNPSNLSGAKPSTSASPTTSVTLTSPIISEGDDRYNGG